MFSLFIKINDLIYNEKNYSKYILDIEYKNLFKN